MIQHNFVHNNGTWNQRQCQRFADDICISIIVTGKLYILIKFSIMFAPKGPIDNNQALV